MKIMSELIGYPREFAAGQGIILVPYWIREEARKRVSQVFGNASHDITIIYEKRTDGNLYETFLKYEVRGLESITPQMIERMRSMENSGIIIDRIYPDDEGRKIRMYVKVHEFSARRWCTRDGIRPYDHRVIHEKNPARGTHSEY